MRFFIALNFENNVKDYLLEIQSLIKESVLKGNYTLYDNFHLTLRFLGEFNQEDIYLFEEVLDELKSSINSFNIKIGGINSFQRKDKHIVFVDVIENRTELNHLANTLNKMIDERLKVTERYQFKPHITIGREIVFKDDSYLGKIIPYQDKIFIDKVSLMLSSRNEHNILTYTPVYTVKLGK